VLRRNRLAESDAAERPSIEPRQIDRMVQATDSSKEPLALLGATALVLVWSGVQPLERVTWWLEVAPVLIGVPLLVISFSRFRLSPLLYRLLFLHAVILMVGGHYTYAQVPIGFWAQDLLDLSRNHYDRVGHLAQGFVPAILAREILLRRSPCDAASGCSSWSCRCAWPSAPCMSSSSGGRRSSVVTPQSPFSARRETSGTLSGTCSSHSWDRSLPRSCFGGRTTDPWLGSGSSPKLDGESLMSFALPTVLRIAAGLIVCVGTLEYFALGEFLPAPFIVALLLFALSFAAPRWRRPVALLVLGLSVLVPIGALVGHLRGDLVMAVPIFDGLLFGWVFWNALHTARSSAPMAVSNREQPG